MWWDLGGDIPPHRKAAPRLGLRCFVVGVVASFPRTGRSYTPGSPFLTPRFPTVFKPPHPTTWPKAPPLLGWGVVASRNRKPPQATTSHHGVKNPEKARVSVVKIQRQAPARVRSGSGRFGSFWRVGFGENSRSRSRALKSLRNAPQKSGGVQGFAGKYPPEEARCSPATALAGRLCRGCRKNDRFRPEAWWGDDCARQGQPSLPASRPPSFRPLCRLAARRRCAWAIGKQSGRHKKSRSKRLVGALLGAWPLPGSGQRRRCGS